MAWSRINIGTLAQAINTNSVPLTVNYAASGILAGDILIYFASNNNTTETITWSNTPTQLAFNSSTTTRGIWASIATGSENGGSVTITGSSTGRMQGVIFTYRGGPSTLTGIANDSQNAGGSAATGLPWPTLTPTVDNCLCLFMGGKSNTNVTGYSNGPATELLDVTSGSTVSMVIEESIQTTKTTINSGGWTVGGDGSASRRTLAVALVAGSAAVLDDLHNQNRGAFRGIGRGY